MPPNSTQHRLCRDGSYRLSKRGNLSTAQLQELARVARESAHTPKQHCEMKRKSSLALDAAAVMPRLTPARFGSAAWSRGGGLASTQSKARYSMPASRMGLCRTMGGK